jgi:hypothetical protein
LIPLRTRAMILPVCATALVSLAAAAGVTAAAEAEARDVWYEVTLGGAPMGHVHETVSLEDGGLIATRTVSDFTMRRGDELVNVKGSGEWRETLGGSPVSYSQTRKMAVETHDLEVTVDPNQLRLRKSDGRDAVFTAIPYKGQLLFPAAIERLHASKGFAPGVQYSYQTFDPDLEVVATFNVKVVGPEDLDMMGETRRLNKLLVTSPAYEGMEFYEWRDDDGRLWREEIPSIESVRQRTTSDVAQREVEAVDILAASTIPSNVKITSPDSVDEAVYELWLDNADIADDVIEDGRQEIVGRTDRGVLLEVHRVVPEPGTTILFPVRSTPLKEYLEGNPMMQTWYPTLLGTAAKQVWGSGQDT